MPFESQGGAVLTIESLRRISRILERLAAGEQPSARELAGAPLAHSWSVAKGEETYRIRAVIAMAPDIHERPRIVTLLAIDRAAGWALVLVANQVSWWLLGTPLPGEATARDEPAEVAQRAAAWTSRHSGTASSRH
jgi:hypothetical protein